MEPRVPIWTIRELILGFIKLPKHTLEETGDVLELRDIVLSVSAVLDQQLERVVELLAGVAGIEVSELFEDDSPLKRRAELALKLFK